MPSVRLYGKHCFSVRFSPFFPQYLACATLEVDTLKGRLILNRSGSLVLLEDDQSNYLKVRRTSYYSSGLSDVSWWQNNENILVTGSCNGSIQIWKLFGSDSFNPLKVFKEHGSNVSSVDSKYDLIASSSFDSTVKIWDVNNCSSVMTLREFGGPVHSVKWSDVFPNMLLSVSKNYHLVLWDRNVPVSSMHKVESFNSESLDCDWNPYNPHEIAVCGSDSIIKIWDIRTLASPVHVLRANKRAITRMKWFPHHEGIIGTISQDLSTVIWDVNKEMILEVIKQHSGVIYGFDFSPLIPGHTVDCAVDSLVYVFTPWSLHDLDYKPFLRNKL